MVLFILEPQQRSALGGGVAFAPLIGIVMGLASIAFKDTDVLPTAAISFVTLYVAAALFGLGSAVTFGVLRHTFTDVMSMTIMFPWAMTVGGYVLWMWPLAYANHRAVARLARRSV